MFNFLSKTRFLVILISVATFQGYELFAYEESGVSGQSDALASSELSDEREFSPLLDNKWIGAGVSYGAYREGQGPQGIQPTREQISEDLNIICKNWNLIRMYGTSEVSQDVLSIIREEKLPLRVLLGAWITNETESDTLDSRTAQLAKSANEREVRELIRLANTYAKEVIAVSVGNETQVYWSDHITDVNILIDYIRQVRSATVVPVSTADDFNYWNKPESKLVAKEVDFIVTHIHAHWAGLDLPGAMAWTKKVYEDICKHHPKKSVVIGEAGWATQIHHEGEQAKHIKGKAGEEEQKEYFHAFTDWSNQEQICTFYFEAFDEPWKGGPHPDEVEKHWGVYTVDRTPKAALQPVK